MYWAGEMPGENDNGCSFHRGGGEGEGETMELDSTTKEKLFRGVVHTKGGEYLHKTGDLSVIQG